MESFYINSNGWVYSLTEEGKIENFEGNIIKVDNLEGFLKDSIKIDKPNLVLEFIRSKLEKKSNLN